MVSIIIPAYNETTTRERDSNFSIIFSWWDRLHKTLLLNIPQKKIVIGVPTYLDKKELTIGYLLKLPFTRIRNRNENKLHYSSDKEIIQE